MHGIEVQLLKSKHGSNDDDRGTFGKIGQAMLTHNVIRGGRLLAALAQWCSLELYNARGCVKEPLRCSQFPACHHDLARSASLFTLNCWHCLILTESRANISAVTA